MYHSIHIVHTVLGNISSLLPATARFVVSVFCQQPNPFTQTRRKTMFPSTENVVLTSQLMPYRQAERAHSPFFSLFNLSRTGFEDEPLGEFMYLVLTGMPGESYRRRLRSLLLFLCDVFRALINSLVCWSGRYVGFTRLVGIGYRPTLFLSQVSN